MHIAVDLRPLIEPFASGVKVYTREMLRALLKQEGVRLTLFYQSARRVPHIHELFDGVKHVPHSSRLFHLRCLFGAPILPKKFFEQRPDLIWFPDRQPFYRTSIPKVMTIHDWVPERLGWTLSWKGRLWHSLFSAKRLLKGMSGVLTPSSFIAKDLPRHLEKEVTYEGACLSQELKAIKHPPQKPFFLTISPADPRKRLSWLLQVAPRFPKVQFLVVGLKEGDKRFKKLPLEAAKNIRFLSEISEEEKHWLLKKAVALLALSEYEGFDLPVLEAVRAKCPVIMSEIPVHHELYKVARPMVSNLDELYLAIYQALEKGAPRPIPRGDYTWDGAAKRALLLFRRVLRNKNG